MAEKQPIETPDTKEKTKKPAPARRRYGNVICAICGDEMKALTPEHLRSHGYNHITYRRVFLTAAHPAPESRANTGLQAIGSDPLGDAARLVADPKFTGNVADAIMHGPLRDRLTLSVTALLEVRSRLHGEAVARLERVNAELSEDWRIKHGGPLGKETSTKDLLLMAQAAQQEVRATEELFMRAAKLAVDEMKGKDSSTLAVPGGLDHYSGSAEKLPVPADLTSAERETIRQLITALPAALAKRRAAARTPLEVAARVVDTAMPAPAPPPPREAPPVCAQTAASDSEPAAKAVDEVTTRPFPATTPMREADEPF